MGRWRLGRLRGWNFPWKSEGRGVGLEVRGRGRGKLVA